MSQKNEHFSDPSTLSCHTGDLASRDLTLRSCQYSKMYVASCDHFLFLSINSCQEQSIKESLVAVKYVNLMNWKLFPHLFYMFIERTKIEHGKNGDIIFLVNFFDYFKIISLSFSCKS